MRAAIAGQSLFELGEPGNRGKIRVAQSLDFLRLPGLAPHTLNAEPYDEFEPIA